LKERQKRRNFETSKPIVADEAASLREYWHKTPSEKGKPQDSIACLSNRLIINSSWNDLN
jgi:hypothetical protein